MQRGLRGWTTIHSAVMCTECSSSLLKRAQFFWCVKRRSPMTAVFASCPANELLVFGFSQLEGSPIVVAQNDKFSASMVDKIACNTELANTSIRQLQSDTVIELVKDYQAWASGDISRQPL